MTDAADLVALDRSPWEYPKAIRDAGAALTIVDGEIVHDGRYRPPSPFSDRFRSNTGPSESAEST